MMNVKGVIICLLLASLPQQGFAAKAKNALPAKKVEKKAPAKKDKIDEYLSKLQKKMVDAQETEPLNLPATDKKELSESDIPIETVARKEAKVSGITPFQQMMGAIGTICLFGLICIFFIFRKGKQGALNSGARNIKVLARKPLGPKRELMVIKVAGESILLGVTEQNINFVKSLAILDDELPQMTPDNFSQELGKNLVADFSQPEAEAAPVQRPDREEVDGYHVSNLSEIQDIVTKRYRG